MKFIDLIRAILRERPEGATPQQIRDQIKLGIHVELQGAKAGSRDGDAQLGAPADVPVAALRHTGRG